MSAGGVVVGVVSGKGLVTGDIARCRRLHIVGIYCFGSVYNEREEQPSDDDYDPEGDKRVAVYPAGYTLLRLWIVVAGVITIAGRATVR